MLAALAAAALIPLGTSAQPAARGTLPRLTQVSHDGCASPLSYHASQVEPMIASHGNTMVATFQVGRVYDGGSCDIGWATSTDGGHTWQTGLLPLPSSAARQRPTRARSRAQAIRRWPTTRQTVNG